MSDILQSALAQLENGKEISEAETPAFFAALKASENETLLADIFRAWHDKGVTANEVFALASLMREHGIKVNSSRTGLLDIVGTGGTGKKTFNISTAAAFVVAGCGVAMAKHGNRAATSRSGSADALAALGVEPAVDAEVAARCIDEIGICFMYAPNFHQLSPTLATVRRSLPFPTIFNLVGPLANPAAAEYMLVGAFDQNAAEKMGRALAKLGTARSWVVHGHDGRDEVALSGETFVTEVAGDQTHAREILPADFGVDEASVEKYGAQTPRQSAELIEQILSGRQGGSAAESIVIVNAAAALYVAGNAASLPEGADQSRESIKSGAAFGKLNALRRLTQK